MKIAVRAIILDGKKVLLVRHKNRDFFSLPGGKVDPDENLKTALRREMIEELGVEIQNPKLKFIHEFRYPNAGEFSVEFFFIVKNAADFKNWKKSSHTDLELAEISWKNFDDDFSIKPDFLREKFAKISEKSPIEYFESSK